MTCCAGVSLKQLSLQVTLVFSDLPIRHLMLLVAAASGV